MRPAGCNRGAIPVRGADWDGLDPQPGANRVGTPAGDRSFLALQAGVGGREQFERRSLDRKFWRWLKQSLRPGLRGIA